MRGRGVRVWWRGFIEMCGKILVRCDDNERRVVLQGIRGRNVIGYGYDRGVLKNMKGMS